MRKFFGDLSVPYGKIEYRPWLEEEPHLDGCLGRDWHNIFGYHLLTNYGFGVVVFKLIISQHEVPLLPLARPGTATFFKEETLSFILLDAWVQGPDIAGPPDKLFSLVLASNPLLDKHRRIRAVWLLFAERNVALPEALSIQVADCGQGLKLVFSQLFFDGASARDIMAQSPVIAGAWFANEHPHVVGTEARVFGSTVSTHLVFPHGQEGAQIRHL